MLSPGAIAGIKGASIALTICLGVSFYFLYQRHITACSREPSHKPTSLESEGETPHDPEISENDNPNASPALVATNHYLSDEDGSEKNGGREQKAEHAMQLLIVLHENGLDRRSSETQLSPSLPASEPGELISASEDQTVCFSDCFNNGASEHDLSNFGSMQVKGVRDVLEGEDVDSELRRFDDLMLEWEVVKLQDTPYLDSFLTELEEVTIP